MTDPFSYLKTRKFRYFFAPLAVLWVVWFGLNKYFLHQSLKQYPIANPIRPVPLSNPYYRLKHEAGITENVGAAATRQSTEESNERAKNISLPFYGLSALQNFSEQNDANQYFEMFFNSVEGFLGGGGFLARSPTDPVREGLKYCRIPYAHNVYGRGSFHTVKSYQPRRDLDPNDHQQSFKHFEKGQEPCIQYENLIVNWGGGGQIGFLLFPERERVPGHGSYYLTFPGYIYGHTNNFDDYKEYVYLCSGKTGEKTSNCKLLGYDQEMESFYKSRPFARGYEYDYYNPYYIPGVFQILIGAWLLWLFVKWLKYYLQYQKFQKGNSNP